MAINEMMSSENVSRRLVVNNAFTFITINFKHIRAAWNLPGKNLLLKIKKTAQFNIDAVFFK